MPGRCQRVLGHQLDGIDQVQHDIGRTLELWVGRMRHDHKPPLVKAAASPVSHRHFERVADARFGWPAGGERMDDAPGIPEKRNMPEHLHPVFRTHSHQELTITAEVTGTERSSTVEVANVRIHLAELGCEQVYYVDSLCLAFEQGCLGAQEV